MLNTVLLIVLTATLMVVIYSIVRKPASSKYDYSSTFYSALVYACSNVDSPEMTYTVMRDKFTTLSHSDITLLIILARVVSEKPITARMWDTPIGSGDNPQDNPQDSEVNTAPSIHIDVDSPHNGDAIDTSVVVGKDGRDASMALEKSVTFRMSGNEVSDAVEKLETSYSKLSRRLGRNTNYLSSLVRDGRLLNEEDTRVIRAYLAGKTPRVKRHLVTREGCRNSGMSHEDLKSACKTLGITYKSLSRLLYKADNYISSIITSERNLNDSDTRKVNEMLAAHMRRSCNEGVEGS